MQKIYLFDVDGTLSKPRQPITEEHAAVFLDWVKRGDRHVYLVTGSDRKKIEEQLFAAFLAECKGLFTCSGNELWKGDTLVYRQKFRAPKGLLADLKLYLEMGAQYHTRTGRHIERRPGMINFSVLGRNANSLQRQAYTKWDKTAQEREDMVEYITTAYPQLEVSIGGAISVDIYPAGKNKAQVVDWLYGEYGHDISMVFVGDRNEPGGNDWPLAMRLEEYPDSHWFQVYSPEETRALIEHSELFI